MWPTSVGTKHQPEGSRVRDGRSGRGSPFRAALASMFEPSRSALGIGLGFIVRAGIEHSECKVRLWLWLRQDRYLDDALGVGGGHGGSGSLFGIPPLSRTLERFGRKT